MPTFKLSWRTRLRLRWEDFKQALDIGGEPGPLMGTPDRGHRAHPATDALMFRP